MPGLDANLTAGGEVVDTAAALRIVAIVHRDVPLFPNQFLGEPYGECRCVRRGSRLPGAVFTGGLGSVGPVADTAYDGYRRAIEVAGLCHAGGFHLDC